MSDTNTVSPLRQPMIEDMAARKLNPYTTACGKRGADVRPDFNWSAGWAIAKAITGVTNCRSQRLKKRWRARNDVAL